MQQGKDDRILLISDLHLEDSRPDITRTLLNFLRDNRGLCQDLYILGDLFEVWIGDDENTALQADIADALADFAKAGSRVFLLHGNRDFLLGRDYASRCCAELLSEPVIIHCASSRVMLMHGDSLCTDDVEYQQFRRMVRQPIWQEEFLAKPLVERQAFARQARAASQEATADKSLEIMDVNPAAVHALFLGSEQSVLIHGHTHRPAVHDLELELPDGSKRHARRVVLGDWDKQAWFAEIIDGEVRLAQRALSA